MKIYKMQLTMMLKGGRSPGVMAINI